jgi:hypothetical protein
MADFSKQWCEINDPEMPSDFDILEVAAGLDLEHFTPIICEGFGFTMISKNKKGKIELFFPTYADNEFMGEWVDYEKFIKDVKKKGSV